jgi:hypothetical protein
MLLDPCTQTRTQRSQNNPSFSIGEVLRLSFLCSTLWFQPDVDGSRGRSQASLPPLLATCTQTTFIYKGAVICDLERRPRFAGGRFDHMWATQLNSYEADQAGLAEHRLVDA